MQNQQPQQPHNHSKTTAFLLWFVRHWRLTLALCVVVGVAFVAWRIKRLTDDGKPLVAIEHSTTIAQTPEEVRALRNIKQWEFLAVETEELIEHHEAHTLGDKHLVKIYRGTLRIGIDMQKAPDDWFSTDSTRNVTLRLPDVGLLDENFIDEARTTTFFEDGSFSAQVKQNLYNQAAEAMKSRTLTDANLAAARETAKEQFSRIFTSLGYRKVGINFVANQEESKPAASAPQKDGK